MLTHYEFTTERRLKIYWEDDGGGSTGEYSRIPVATVLQLPTQYGADLTRDLLANGWGIRQEDAGPAWHRAGEPPTLTRDAVALQILCALLTIPEQARAFIIKDAFELADRFVAVATQG